MNLTDAVAKEEADRQAHMDAARAVGIASVSTATVAASQAIIGAIAGTDGGSALGEPARDLRRIRLDPKVQESIRYDQSRTLTDAFRLIVDAALAGFAIAGQTRAVPLGLSATVTDEDRADLAGLPIQGFTAQEWAADLARALGDDVNRALAMPLSSTVDPRSIPTELSRVAETAAGRLAFAVEQAHLAGVAAAIRAVGQALTGKG